MRLSCPACAYSTEVPDHLLPPAGSRGRCSNCSRSFSFDGRGLVDEDPTPVNPIQAVAPDEATPTPTGPGAPAPPPPPLAGAAAAAAGATAAQTSSGPKPLPDGWIIKVGLNPAGPFTGSDVKARIRNGQLAETQEVMVPGTEVWVGAGQVPELQRLFAIRRAATAPKVSAKDTGVQHCGKHPVLKAEWACAKCGPLCNACTVVKDLGPVRNVRTCAACGDACHAIKKEEVIVPFWEDLPNLLAFPVRNGGWVAIIVCAITGLARDIAMGFVASLILGLCLLAYHLFIVKTSAWGAKEVPNLGNVENIVDDMMIPGFKACFVSAVALFPLLAYGCHYVGPAIAEVAETSAAVAAYEEPAEEEETSYDFGYEGEGGEEVEAEAAQAFENFMGDQGYATEGDDTAAEGEEPAWTPDEYVEEETREDLEAAASKAQARLLFHSLAFLALWLYALIVWPILMIIVAIYNTVMPAFNPVAIGQVLMVIKKEYAIGLIFIFVLGVTAIVTQIPFGFIPYVGSILGALPFYYLTFMGAHVLGRMAQMAQAKLGW